MSDMDLERIFWVTAITHLGSTLITLPCFSLKAFSATAPVESGLESLCGSLDSSLLSASCSLGFTPALPFTGNISFSSFLFLHSDHSLSVGWKNCALPALCQVLGFLLLIILIAFLSDSMYVYGFKPSLFKTRSWECVQHFQIKSLLGSWRRAQNCISGGCMLWSYWVLLLLHHLNNSVTFWSADTWKLFHSHF